MHSRSTCSINKRTHKQKKSRGKWLGRFSGRLAAGWHPSVHVQRSLPYPSPCFSLYGWRAVVSGSLQAGAISAWPGTWPSQVLTWPLLTVAECSTGAAPGRDLLWFPIPGNPLQWQDMAPEAVWSTIAVLQCGTDQETAAWETGLGYNHQTHTTLALCSWTRVNKSRRFCKISKALGTNSSSKWDCRGHFALHSGQWGQYALSSPSAS